MLGFGGVFGRKPRQFNYRPRFYDPEKEARDERRKELFGEVSGADQPEGYVPGQYLRNSMMARRGYAGHAKKKKRLTGFRAVLILVLLGLAVYWVLS